MTTTSCSCSPATSTSGGAALERTRYFAGQLVTPEDLTQDQTWVRERARRRNRLLWGWGVVCGAAVRPGNDRCQVIVEPGFIIGPYGDEIMIDEEAAFDVCGVVQADSCDTLRADPWCDDVRTACSPGTRYLAVRYVETNSRAVRAPSGSCGSCEPDSCEYSRIREGFELCLLDELPETYDATPQSTGLGILNPCRGPCGRPCPQCPTSPWVVLADIVIDEQCQWQTIDCLRHRRFTISWAEFAHYCGRLSTGPIAGARATLGLVTGYTELIDPEMEVRAAPPVMTLRLLRADGSSVGLPAYFNVEAGETLGAFLEREGARQLYDPVADQNYTLRELFRLSGADASTTLASRAAALGLLEDRKLEVVADRVSRTALEVVLTDDGIERLEREFLGAPERAIAMRLTELVGGTELAEQVNALRQLTVAEIAGVPQSEFAGEVSRAVPEEKQEAARAQAMQLWRNAQRTVAIARRREDS